MTAGHFAFVWFKAPEGTKVLREQNIQLIGENEPVFPQKIGERPAQFFIGMAPSRETAVSG